MPSVRILDDEFELRTVRRFMFCCLSCFVCSVLATCFSAAFAASSHLNERMVYLFCFLLSWAFLVVFILLCLRWSKTNQPRSRIPLLALAHAQETRSPSARRKSLEEKVELVKQPSDPPIYEEPPAYDTLKTSVVLVTSMCAKVMAARYENDSRNYNRHNNFYNNTRNNSNNRKYYDNNRRRNDYRDHREDRREKEETRENNKEKVSLGEWGDWSEHLSSSGKRYYYNNKTEISQWEKPTDWAEAEKKQQSNNDRSHKTTQRAGSQTSQSSVPQQASQASCSDSPSSSGGQRTSRKRERDWNEERRKGQDKRHKPQSNAKSETVSKTGDRSSVPAAIPQLLLDFASKCGVDLHQPGAVEKLKRTLENSLKKEPVVQSLSAPSCSSQPTLSSCDEQTGLLDVTHDTDDNTHTQSPIAEPLSVSSSEGVCAPTASHPRITRSPSPPTVTLSSSHLRFAKASLVAHATGWAAEHFENQADVYEENQSSVWLSVLDTASDLKCSRALVRTTEIKSTLLEQQVRFVRAQCKQLDSSTPSKMLSSAPT